MLFRVLREAMRPSAVRRVMGVNKRNRALVYAHNPRRHFPVADDKLRTKGMLQEAGVPVPNTLEVFSSLHEARSAAERLSSREEFVIKPSQGKTGNGIVVLVGRVEEGWLDSGGRLWRAWDVGRHVSNIVFGNYANGLSDRALIEERIIARPLLDADEFPGLPDVRVLTLGSRPVMAMLRLPTRRSEGKANLHQGAVGVGVDLETGVTVHAAIRGGGADRHPDSGTPLLGRRVSDWTAIVEVARRTARALPLGYLGIDIVCDVRRGPLVLEANARPGLEIQNANRMGLEGALARLTGTEEES
jgi:alpha-L-glutamate ligase-like protein